MTDLALATPADSALALRQAARRQAQDYSTASLAESTRRAYASDWQHFVDWCASRGLASLPAAPETVALYVADLAPRHAVRTLERRLAAISTAHQLAGHDEPPTRTARVRKVMSGIRRTHGVAADRAAPVTLEVLRALLATLDPASLLGKRDRALLLLGFAGAFRRSELVALDVEDLEEAPHGLTVRLRRSKTDQEGRGELKAIPRGYNGTCPVTALREWLAAAGITAGPIFRPVNRHGQVLAERLSDKAVALVVKRSAGAAGLDPGQFSGHSLRAGFATTAALNGAAERTIANQTGHRSTRVLRGYIRRATVWQDNAVTMLGL